MKEYVKRKSSRLKNYNYSQNGAYFLTICTKDRKMLLGSVGAGVPDGPQICLTEYGEVVENVIHSINDTYAHISIEKYVVMPNHVHMIVSIDRSANGRRGRRPLQAQMFLLSFLCLNALLIERSARTYGSDRIMTMLFAADRTILKYGNTLMKILCAGVTTNMQKQTANSRLFLHILISGKFMPLRCRRG